MYWEVVTQIRFFWPNQSMKIPWFVHRLPLPLAPSLPLPPPHKAESEEWRPFLPSFFFSFLFVLSPPPRYSSTRNLLVCFLVLEFYRWVEVEGKNRFLKREKQVKTLLQTWAMWEIKTGNFDRASRVARLGGLVTRSFLLPLATNASVTFSLPRGVALWFYGKTYLSAHLLLSLPM